MDMERTMNFIVENLASVTVRQDRAEKQIEAIRKLVVTGMKMVIEIQRAQKRNDRQIDRLTKRMDELAEAQKELAASQKETDRRFNQWLEMNRGSNGHKQNNGQKGGNGSKKKLN